MVRFSDLDFTVETSNLLVRAVNRFGHETLLERLRSEASIDLSEPLALIERRLNAALTRELAPGIRFDGFISRLRPHTIYPVQGGVEVQLLADGVMRISLR